jgi:hypothetical protein
MVLTSRLLGIFISLALTSSAVTALPIKDDLLPHVESDKANQNQVCFVISQTMKVIKTEVIGTGAEALCRANGGPLHAVGIDNEHDIIPTISLCLAPGQMVWIGADLDGGKSGQSGSQCRAARVNKAGNLVIQLAPCRRRLPTLCYVTNQDEL